MINKRGFTLLETLFVLAGFFAMIVIVLQVYTTTIQSKNINTMRQVVVEEAHYLTQFFKTALQNYSPDYEEYFARRTM
jgi:Tfp pilus assembly protein PilE